MVRKRMLHIDVLGALNGEKNRGRVYGCGCGDGWEDAACGGGYVCSCFVMLCENLIIREGKEWTIIYAIRCKGSKEARLPCEGMGIYTLSYWVDMGMGHYNESH